MKKIKNCSLAVTLLFLLFGFNKASAQTPTYRLSVTNVVQTSTNALEFDVFVLRTGSTSLEYQTMQFGLKFDTMITWLNNAGTPGVPHHSFIVPSIVSGSSELCAGNQNQNVQFYSVNSSTGWAAAHHFNMAPVLATGPCTISNVDNGCGHPGTRIARFRMVAQASSTNTTPAPFFTNSVCNLQFSTGPAAQITNTIITAYVNGSPTGSNITNTASHMAYNSANTCCPNFPLNAPPTISSMSPMTMTIGVGQVLTINGSGFGATRGTGNISFKNANDGGATSVQLDNLDWTNATWTDNQIQVIIPSITATGGPAGFGGVPGSGTVSVTNGIGLTGTSAGALNIECAIKDFTLLKNRAYLVGNACVNGITFYYGGSNTPSASQKTVIAAACSTWAAYLAIDIKISTTTQSALMAQNGFSTIFVGGTPDPTETEVYGFACSGKDIIVEGDITYNGALNWSYVLPGTNLPANTYDFYAHMLHAIGKVLGLENVIDAANGGSEVMNWSIPAAGAGGITAANRTSLTSGGGNGASGALNQVVIPSRNLVINSCTPYVQLVTGSTAAPVITATASGACTNNPVTITCNASGVGVTYVWSNGATSNPIQVSTPGNYSVTVTFNNSSCTATSNVLTISGLLPSIINIQPVATSICAGGNGATLTCTGPGGSTYQWQRNINNGGWTNVSNGTYYSGVTTSTLTVNNAQYYNGSSQEYRCLVSQNSSCTAFSNSAALTVQLVSLAALPSVYTSSSAVTLVGTPSGGTYSGTGVSSNLFTPPATAGYYNITYTKTGCTPSAAVQTIQVVACCAKTVTTNTNPGNMCLDGNLTFPITYTALGTPYSTTGFVAQLSTSTGAFPGTNIGSTSASGSGTISVTIPSGASNGTAYKIRVVSNDGTVVSIPNQTAFSISHSPCDGDRVAYTQQEEMISQDVSIYPNPANNHITIDLPDEKSEYQIELFDINGKIFITRKVGGKNSEEIDLSDLTSGTYFVKLSSNDLVLNKKLLIIK